MGSAFQDFLDWLDPAWVAASAACAGGAAAWFAAITGRSTLRQVKRDSAERSRPQVAAELRSPPYSKGIQALVVRNYGPTIARNVRVTFRPLIPDPDDPASSVTPFLKRRYSRPIPALTPSMELENLWFVGEADPSGKFVNTEPTPDEATVTIEYQDGQGRTFRDDFPIDVSIIRDHTYSESSTAPESQRKAAVKAFEQISSNLRDIAKSGRLMTAEQRQDEIERMEERRTQQEPLRRALGLEPPTAPETEQPNK